MDFTARLDSSGGLICGIGDGATSTTVTAAEPTDAARELLAAIQATEQEPVTECFWQVPGGEYRWMLRRDGPRFTVVVLWSAGTLTGWQHVFRDECDATWFLERVRAEFDAIGVCG